MDSFTDMGNSGGEGARVGGGEEWQPGFRTRLLEVSVGQPGEDICGSSAVQSCSSGLNPEQRASCENPHSAHREGAGGLYHSFTA